MTIEPSPLDPLAAFRLDGRVVLLTGASAGLGARFARVLHAVGATVVLVARRVDRLQALAADLAGADPIGCDLGDGAAREKLVSEVLDRHGRIDVLVNNAGMAGVARPEDEPWDSWTAVMGLNLDAPFHLSQLCAKRDMLPRGEGCIVNVASMLGIVSSGRLSQASYAASKGGLVNLTRELACLWARKGIRVNALCPGFFDSELTGDFLASPVGREYIDTNTPMRRFGGESELDGALLLLASPASSFMTGTTLVVDGGWTAK